MPKNPGRPDRKYFVGLPIPSAAAMVAGVIYFDGRPIHWWVFSALWLGLLGLLSFLMVSTWRYPSFKDLSLTQPRSPLTFVVLGILICGIAFFSQPVLLLLSGSYVLSGIVIRIGGVIRRRLRPGSGNPEPQAGAERPTEAEHRLDSSRLDKVTDRPLVALVGGETLLAKEVRAVLEESKPSPRVQLISATADGSTLLGADEDEPLMMTPLNAQSLKGAKVVVPGRLACVQPQDFEDQPSRRTRADRSGRGARGAAAGPPARSFGRTCGRGTRLAGVHSSDRASRGYRVGLVALPNRAGGHDPAQRRARIRAGQRTGATRFG